MHDTGYGPISTQEVEQLIRTAFPTALIQVKDLRGGDHFGIEVISESFQGKSLIEQHQAVHAALRSEMDRRIHAVQIKTKVA